MKQEILVDNKIENKNKNNKKMKIKNGVKNTEDTRKKQEGQKVNSINSSMPQH